MTGRDLIIYILSNGLEDEPVFKDGKLLGFMTEEEAAVALNMGVQSVRTLYILGKIDCVFIGDKMFISKTSIDNFVQSKGEANNEK